MKYLSAELIRQGYIKSKKSVLPYLAVMLKLGVLKETGDNLRPYKIQRSKEEMTAMINGHIDIMSGR